jgi:hypothetical protein
MPRCQHPHCEDGYVRSPEHARQLPATGGTAHPPRLVTRRACPVSISAVALILGKMGGRGSISAPDLIRKYDRGGSMYLPALFRASITFTGPRVFNYHYLFLYQALTKPEGYPWILSPVTLIRAVLSTWSSGSSFTTRLVL